MPESWLDQLHSELQNEMKNLSAGAQAQFAQIRPKQAPAPTPHEKAQQFLNTPITQMQQMAVQMGPQAWKDYMDQNMNNVAETMGNDQASKLASFYSQSQLLPQTPDIMQTGLESELMQLIGANGGGPDNSATGLS